MKQRIRKLCMGVSLLLSLCLAGCGMFSPLDGGAVKEPDSTSLESDGLIVVGFAQIGSESVWRTANTASIQKALSKENGYFLLYKNARQKQENQIKAIREFISQRVDYIVFSPASETGWENVLQEAKTAGIPVILVDRKVDVSDESLYTSWIGSDMQEEGRKAGLWLEEEQRLSNPEEKELNIVVLKGTEGATATIGRTKGFHEIADKHPNWKILEETSADFTTAKGEEVMEKMLKKYPKIDVVISQNDDMTFGAIHAIENAGKTVGVDGDIKMVSFDATKAGLILTWDGQINLNIECNPYQGEYVQKIIRDMENGFYVLKQNYVEESVFTQDNVADALQKRTY